MKAVFLLLSGILASIVIFGCVGDGPAPGGDEVSVEPVKKPDIVVALIEVTGVPTKNSID